jgi:rhodanese-related sulfurtransferase
MRDRWWWRPFGRVPDIDAASLQAELDNRDGLQLIDVRTPVEYGRGHIAGAVNVPITRLKSALPALELDPDRLVVAICATAHRSPPAVRLLRQAGFTARQLRGGMIAWNHSNLPLTKGNE